MLKRQNWTREDDIVLQHIYPHASDSEVAKQMQRTVWSVKSRAKRLHLTKDAEYRAVLNQTEEEQEGHHTPRPEEGTPQESPCLKSRGLLARLVEGLPFPAETFA